nr:MAG TPA: hypothetical protein [Caudoviricetes sp.]
MIHAKLLPTANAAVIVHAIIHLIVSILACVITSLASGLSFVLSSIFIHLSCRVFRYRCGPPIHTAMQAYQRLQSWLPKGTLPFLPPPLQIICFLTVRNLADLHQKPQLSGSKCCWIAEAIVIGTDLKPQALRHLLIVVLLLRLDFGNQYADVVALLFPIRDFHALTSLFVFMILTGFRIAVDHPSHIAEDIMLFIFRELVDLCCYISDKVSFFV